jgi:alcohol dehydrogenase (cytochrome c)
MNHGTYDGQLSPLARINRDNVKASSSPMRCRSAAAPAMNGSNHPAREDDFLYITDSWGVLYKIDGTSGTLGRIVWRMDPSKPNSSATAAPRSGTS